MYYFLPVASAIMLILMHRYHNVDKQYDLEDIPNEELYEYVDILDFLYDIKIKFEL